MVLGQFRKDVPGVIHSNTDCYQGNHSPEAIFILCRQKGIKLLSYDYNKPCCGKDQCYHGSTAAKRIIRSFIDSGNDLLAR